jgi:hypothetical protein
MPISILTLFVDLTTTISTNGSGAVLHRQHSSAQGRILFYTYRTSSTYTKMRSILAPLLLAPLTALAAPDILAPFELAVPTSENNATLQDDGSELFKRQGSNACATNYYACTALNAPGLCCRRDAICTADISRNVACCPQGAVCTGTLGAGAPTATASLPSTALATTTTTGSFVQASSVPNGGQASTVQNAFFPFPYIPTTYSNAAACSSAYTSCQGVAASCTTALANGAMGVTVSAPNGGATITAVPSVGLQSAQSICSSLSLQACSGLQVEACRSFGGEGNAAMTRGGCEWMVGVGVAVGVAGQLLR